MTFLSKEQTKEELVNELRALRHKAYPCLGPSRLVSLMGGHTPKFGTSMSYQKCLNYPDCGCLNYDRITDEIDDLEEEIHDALNKI